MPFAGWLTWPLSLHWEGVRGSGIQSSAGGAKISSRAWSNDGQASINCPRSPAGCSSSGPASSGSLWVVVSRGLCQLRDVTSSANKYSLIWPWGVRLPWWCRWPALRCWHMISTICMRRGLIIIKGANWATPKTQPTEFKIDVEFPPPGVVQVSWHLQPVGVQLVPLNVVSDDEAKVNF